MAYQDLQESSVALWALAESQHGAVARSQLLELGLSPSAIKHRVAKGRLHPLWRGVYAVGRPQLSRRGVWMAALLACGPEAVLSHRSAAAMWRIHFALSREIDVSVPAHLARRRTRIRVHRRTPFLADDIVELDGVRLTSPVCTLIDLAPGLSRDELEAAINQADRLDLVDPDDLRLSLDGRSQRGAATVRKTLDQRTFVMTDSELERRFRRLARQAGLPRPQTRQFVNGYRVDFYWPELGLVVETDGLRYHRTPAQQAQDRLRDQAHTAAGLTSLRFTHGQVRYEPAQALATLSDVARRLQRPPG